MEGEKALPEGMTFMGGSMSMPGGTTAYVWTQFEPGAEYAWIGEVPNPAEKNMLKTSTASSSGATAER